MVSAPAKGLLDAHVGRAHHIAAVVVKRGRRINKFGGYGVCTELCCLRSLWQRSPQRSIYPSRNLAVLIKLDDRPTSALELWHHVPGAGIIKVDVTA